MTETFEKAETVTTEDIRKRDVEQTLNQIKVARDRLARKAVASTGEQDRRLLIAAELERQAAFPPATLECSCAPAVFPPAFDAHPAESDPACLVDGDPAVLGQIVAEMDALLRLFGQAIQEAEVVNS
jgi:hypothetical protein